MGQLSLIGALFWKIVLSNKYKIDFNSDEVVKNVQRLTNQLWKLIPMREHQEDWKKQLETVLIEIAGLRELFLPNASLIQLFSKLEGLNILEDVSFEMYRKTVFECISLLRESLI